MTTKTVCPVCKRPFGKRICAKCGFQIGSHHKYYFNKEGRVQHRNCKNVESYK